MTSRSAADALVPLRMERWVPLVIWLSLDAVRPSWSRVGFPCSPAEKGAWIALLRRAIRRAAASRWTSPQAPLPLVADVLVAGTQELGETAAASLLGFGRFVFAMGPDDHPELFAWRELLEQCETDTATLRTLAPWPEVRDRFVDGLERARGAREDLALPLSSWDVAMLALRGIDDADRDAPEHPMRLCEWTARVTSTRAMWRTVLPLLDEGRCEALAWNGTRLAWSLGMLPEDASLPDPSTLVEGVR
jgi:hypothetical protein